MLQCRWQAFIIHRFSPEKAVKFAYWPSGCYTCPDPVCDVNITARVWQAMEIWQDGCSAFLISVCEMKYSGPRHIFHKKSGFVRARTCLTGCFTYLKYYFLRSCFCCPFVFSSKRWNFNLVQKFIWCTHWRHQTQPGKANTTCCILVSIWLIWNILEFKNKVISIAHIRAENKNIFWHCGLTSVSVQVCVGCRVQWQSLEQPHIRKQPWFPLLLGLVEASRLHTIAQNWKSPVCQ